MMNQEINTKAPVIERQEIEIQAPAEVVWEVLTDIENWPSWQENVKSTKVNGPIAEDTSFVWKASGLTFHSQLHTVKTHQAFGWTGKIMGTFAIHNWNLNTEGERTRVHVEESLEGFFPSLMKKSFQKNLTAGMKKNLIDLKAESERRVSNE